MKLKTLLMSLMVTGTALVMLPAQADSKEYVAGDWQGLMLAKRGDDDRRHYEDDDDDDDRRRGGKRGDRAGNTGYGNSDGAPSREMPANPRASFKERLYIQRQQERDQNKVPAE